jgi:RHS repeat-associated protein
MQMPGRRYNSGNEYRYGFNGKEKSDEIFNQSLAYEYRIYDSRIGKWLSTDPLESTYVGLSPYNFGANSPIKFYDVDGRFLGTLIGAVVGGIKAAVKGENVLKGIGKGALAGAAADLAFIAIVGTGGIAAVGIGTAIAAGAAAGAAGSIVGQALDIADGTQKKFSWKSFGLSTLIGAATGGLAKAFAPQISNGIAWVTSRVFRKGAWRKSRVEVGPCENVSAPKTTTPTETPASTETATTNTDAQPKLDAPTSESVSSDVAKVAEEAAKGVGKNFSKISDKLLKKSGVDAHALKREWLGDKAPIAQYDLYKASGTGEILILKKGGVGEPIHTGEFIK